jgi:hypothetical protein
MVAKEYFVPKRSQGGSEGVPNTTTSFRLKNNLRSWMPNPDTEVRTGGVKLTVTAEALFEYGNDLTVIARAV